MLLCQLLVIQVKWYLYKQRKTVALILKWVMSKSCFWDKQWCHLHLDTQNGEMTTFLSYCLVYAKGVVINIFNSYWRTWGINSFINASWNISIISNVKYLKWKLYSKTWHFLGRICHHVIPIYCAQITSVLLLHDDSHHQQTNNQPNELLYPTLCMLCIKHHMKITGEL